MGYTFKIGEAVLTKLEEDGEVFNVWDVADVELENAPNFPNDTLTGKSNSRHPSYTAWSDFCSKAGLYNVFYTVRGHLLHGHPGCMPITEELCEVITEALEKYKKTSTLPPGFEEECYYNGEPNYDYHLARLIWLEWWVGWAFENCENPAICNW